MPRAIVALIVTVVAVVLLASFRTTPTQVAIAPATASKPAPSRAPSRAHSKAPSPSRKKAAPPHRRSTPRTITGSPVQQPYGTVQVAVTMSGTRISDVRTLAIPLDNGRSQSINSQAAPLLRSEVLQAQSAQINIVSGATYTSEAYAQSLQSALARARA